MLCTLLRFPQDDGWWTIDSVDKQNCGTLRKEGATSLSF